MLHGQACDRHSCCNDPLNKYLSEPKGFQVVVHTRPITKLQSHTASQILITQGTHEILSLNCPLRT